jgi:hypothetical protein
LVLESCIRHSNGIGKMIRKMSVTMFVIAMVSRFAVPRWQLGGLLWSICQNLFHVVVSILGLRRGSNGNRTYNDNGRHSSMVERKTPRNVRTMNQCRSMPDRRR